MSTCRSIGWGRCMGSRSLCPEIASLARVTVPDRLLRASASATLIGAAGCTSMLGADFEGAHGVTLSISMAQNPSDESATGSGEVRIDDGTRSCTRDCSFEVPPNQV